MGNVSVRGGDLVDIVESPEWGALFGRAADMAAANDRASRFTVYRDVTSNAYPLSNIALVDPQDEDYGQAWIEANQGLLNSRHCVVLDVFLHADDFLLDLKSHIQYLDDGVYGGRNRPVLLACKRQQPESYGIVTQRTFSNNLSEVSLLDDLRDRIDQSVDDPAELSKCLSLPGFVQADTVYFEFDSGKARINNPSAMEPFGYSFFTE